MEKSIILMFGLQILLREYGVAYLKWKLISWYEEIWLKRFALE